jgi:hypothetical protein
MTQIGLTFGHTLAEVTSDFAEGKFTVQIELECCMGESGVLENKAIEVAERIATAMDCTLELATVSLGGERPGCPDRSGGDNSISYVQ